MFIQDWTSAHEAHVLVDNGYMHCQVHRGYCIVKDLTLPMVSDSETKPEPGPTISTISMFTKHGSTINESVSSHGASSICTALNKGLRKYENKQDLHFSGHSYNASETINSCLCDSHTLPSKSFFFNGCRKERKSKTLSKVYTWWSIWAWLHVALDLIPTFTYSLYILASYLYYGLCFLNCKKRRGKFLPCGLVVRVKQEDVWQALI